MDHESTGWNGRFPNSLEEHLASGHCEALPDLLPVELRVFVSGRCGSRGISTGTLTFPPLAELPYHQHEFSEALTSLQGQIDLIVRGRCYRLRQHDCIHVPARTPHRVFNRDESQTAVAHYAFASEAPTWELVNEDISEVSRGLVSSEPGAPEHVSRLGNTEAYDLAGNTKFYDLFAGRFGSVGICGGYAEFSPGTSLPCHVHKFDESITIVTGQAICQVAGRRYSLSGRDTTFIPEGLPHRFLNDSDDVMAMIWVYAGSEPERVLVSTGYCDGTSLWLPPGGTK